MRGVKSMFDTLKDILADHFDIEKDSITEETSLRDDLGADSLDLLEMVMALEDEYDMEINAEDDLESIQTVGDVMDYLKQHGIE